MVKLARVRTVTEWLVCGGETITLRTAHNTLCSTVDVNGAVLAETNVLVTVRHYLRGVQFYRFFLLYCIRGSTAHCRVRGWDGVVKVTHHVTVPCSGSVWWAVCFPSFLGEPKTKVPVAR
jgi:hypothetical protein